jgi:hypothetical protein
VICRFAQCSLKTTRLTWPLPGQWRFLSVGGNCRWPHLAAVFDHNKDGVKMETRISSARLVHLMPTGGRSFNGIEGGGLP